MSRTYICIDLKSFYASVELAARKYDPLTTNLVVADAERTEKTICLAVSPSLKALGISGRARLFEVVRRVKEVNAERFRRARSLGLLPKGPDGSFHFAASSFDANALAADPSLELSYIVATPRMTLYETVSTQIFSIYSKYISPDDIHVYSIDECFMDVTAYLHTYGLTARELAMRMIRDVLNATGITATAGIGDNMYLAKIAMDIVAKHVPADEQGVRIAYLNEQLYRETLWCHTPITDFWRVGRGTAARVAKLGCLTMGDIAKLSLSGEGRLYAALGVNAELLIDHAWGREPTEISTIKGYTPESRSLSAGQVLKEPYDWEKGKLIVREMTELLVLDLVRKGAVTRQVTLTINYDKESLEEVRQEEDAGGASARRGKNSADTIYIVKKTGAVYQGEVAPDYYGRLCPKHAHGTGNLGRWTSSTAAIMDVMMALYDRITDKDLLIRRVNIAASDVIPEAEIPEAAPEQMDLFTDYEALEREEEKRKAAEDRERRMQKAALSLQSRFGKNVILKGMNLLEGGTTRERNEMIGGHRAGSAESEKRKAVGESTRAKDRQSHLRDTDGETQDTIARNTETIHGEKPDTISRKTGNVQSYQKTDHDKLKSRVPEGPDPKIVYADIINLPPWQPTSRPRMSLHDRSAQFAAYKTLSGYEDMVNETVRLTDRAPELEEYEQDMLNRRLLQISDALARGEHPLLTLTVFIPDEKKDGGRYEDVTAAVKRIDEQRRKIVLTDPKSSVQNNIEFDIGRVVNIR